MTARRSMNPLISATALLLCLNVYADAQDVFNVSLRPARLNVGDRKVRDITLEADVSPKTVLHISVQYTSDPNTPTMLFIPKFTVRDNSSGDRNPQEEKIRVVLPKAFEKEGVYTVEVDETKSPLRLVHGPDDRSLMARLADYLGVSAGPARGGTQTGSAIDRLSERNGRQAIWVTSMPSAIGRPVDEEGLNLKIRTAMMPAWSPNSDHIACSLWQQGKWVIAVYKLDQTGKAVELWVWNPPGSAGHDFSPVWAPGGQAIAFVRQTPDQSSDIWVLRLDQNRLPKAEVQVTNLNWVQEVLGWNDHLGIMFEIHKKIRDSIGVRQLWALKTNNQQQITVGGYTPLSDPYKLIRGSAPRRQTLIYTEENDDPPISVVYEMKADGERRSLLTGDVCSYKWPAVSPDGKWLAIDSNCHQNR